MLRIRRMSLYTLLVFALSLAIAKGVGNIAAKNAQVKYQEVVERCTPLEGEIGSRAGEDAFRAQSIEDLLEHDTFTVVSPGIQYRNCGSGYYKEGAVIKYMSALTLPSGERVAAWIYSENVQEEGGTDFYSSDKVMPLGHLVYADLSLEQTFLDQIEFLGPLDRKDFYLDMVGTAAELNEEQYIQVRQEKAKWITFIILAVMLHVIPYIILKILQKRS